MADISKEDLKKEITAVLKGADLSATSAKKVRQQVEEKLSIDLSSRKKEIDEIVMGVLASEKKGAKKAKKNGNKADDDEEDGDEDERDEDKEEDEEEEEEEDEEEEEKKKPKRAGTPKKQGAKRRKSDSDESEEGSDAGKESDEEYSPNKKAKGAAKPKKGAAKGRKKKGSDSDSDEDWGKGKKGSAKKGAAGQTKRRGTSGYNKTCTLTPELAKVVGQDAMARHEVVKKVWSIIKEQNLYDPKNKQYAICNDDLMKVIGVKRFRTFGMMKYLKKHFVD